MFINCIFPLILSLVCHFIGSYEKSAWSIWFKVLTYLNAASAARWFINHYN